MYRRERANPVLVLIAACSLAITTRTSHAQVGHTFLSLEWRVAQAGAVVRGAVDDVQFKPLKDGHGWLIATVNVRETIKGTNSAKLEFSIWSYGAQDEFTQWKKSGQELLWFLSHDKATKTQLQNESKGLPVPTEWVLATGYYPIELSRSQSQPVARKESAVFLADLTVREKPEDILAAARNAAKQQGSKPPRRSHRFEISRALAQQSGTSGDVNSLVVPIDASLEANAHKWISTPADFIDQLDKSQLKDKQQRNQWLAYERDQLRKQGVTALKYFPSDENIALLRGLLNDPTTNLVTSDRDGVEVTHKVYSIRKAAYAVLKKWDVLVERAHLSEPAPYEKRVAGVQRQRATTSSSDDWRTRIVQSDGLSLTVSLPANLTPRHLPLQLALFNQGQRVALIGETGYCLDCKLTLQAEDGNICKFTRLGDEIFGERENPGQYAFIRLRQDRARRWECELADHFEQLTPGNYRLTLEANVEFHNNVSGEFSDTKTLVAKDLRFQVREANKSR